MARAAEDPLIGTVAAGRYRVLKQLGEGGMGQVYLAEHVAIEKRIALKVLHAEYAHKGEIVARFQQEAISASRIKHPNVLDVFDFGQLENGGTVTIGENDDALTFGFEPRGEATETV